MKTNSITLVDDGWSNGPIPHHQSKQPQAVRKSTTKRKSFVKLGHGLLD